jgi:chloramphenicol-sensitive protein RarD
MSRAVPRGSTYGVGAYAIWGLFPLYFHLLARSTAIEVVLHRVLWSLVICLGVVSVSRGWADVVAVARRPRDLALLATAALVLVVNWGVYVYAVNSGQVIEASLGYFVNPLITVLLGVLVLRERLRRLQWAAVGIGALAVAVLTIDYGRPPVIALTLAVSFGCYGLLKNRVGPRVGALAGLTTETWLAAPLAGSLLIWYEVTGRGTFGQNPPWQGLLLASAGIATVAPLLLFAAAIRRSPLSTIGLLQYLTPVLQLLCGVAVLGERMPLSRWIGFTLVWGALALLTADSLRTARRRRRVGADDVPAPCRDLARERRLG